MCSKQMNGIDLGLCKTFEPDEKIYIRTCIHTYIHTYSDEVYSEKGIKRKLSNKQRVNNQTEVMCTHNSKNLNYFHLFKKYTPVK